MINKIVFLSLLFTLSAAISAAEIDVIQKDDNIESIAKRNIEGVQLKYNNRLQDYQNDIKKWNPRISDWQHPPLNQKIYVDYPYSHYLTSSTWTPDLNSIESKEEVHPQFSLAGYYAASAGTYTETISAQSITSDQNFPITLGLLGNVTNDEKRHYLLSSLYFAKSSNGNVSSNSTSSKASLSSSLEIGGNIYYQYNIESYKLGFFSGYDYEKLSSLNTNEIITGKTIRNIKNNLHYLTIGLAKDFLVYDLRMNLRASASKIVGSSTSGTDKLTGSNFLFQYTYNPRNRFNYGLFYKHYSLKGSTDLSINRIGLSLGYLFF
jgi:hypothetical protein